jgi:heme oxygenase
MQQQFDRFLNDDTVPAYSARRKPSWIRNDIQQCNEVMNPPLCNQIPVIQNKYEALGAFYVLEGSVMGGAIISKKLKEQLNIDDSCLSFFRGYGENNPSMWKDFLNVLDGIEEGSQEANAVIKKAKDSFSTFKTWIDEQHG